MKFRSAYATVPLISTCLLLLAGVRFAPAAEIKIVSPSSYKDQEGAGAFGSLTQPASPYRYQQLFPAEDFAVLGNRPHWLVGFAPRPDQSVTTARTANLPDNEVRLSTTERSPTNLSLRFDENHGSNVMQFYRGALTMVTDAQGTVPGPREFYQADFAAGVTPFLYDPSQGNLLFDFIAWQGESPAVRADQVPGIQTVVNGSPSATQGGRDGAAVFQFTFIPVPEPSTALLALVGSLALAARCRANHDRLRC